MKTDRIRQANRCNIRQTAYGARGANGHRRQQEINKAVDCAEWDFGVFAWIGCLEVCSSDLGHDACEFAHIGTTITQSLVLCIVVC